MELKLQELTLKQKDLEDELKSQEESYQGQLKGLKEDNERLRKTNQDYFNRITTSIEEVKIKSEEPKQSFDEFVNKLGGIIK